MPQTSMQIAQSNFDPPTERGVNDILAFFLRRCGVPLLPWLPGVAALLLLSPGLGVVLSIEMLSCTGANAERTNERVLWRCILSEPKMQIKCRGGDSLLDGEGWQRWFSLRGSGEGWASRLKGACITCLHLHCSSLSVS